MPRDPFVFYAHEAPGAAQAAHDPEALEQALEHERAAAAALPVKELRAELRARGVALEGLVEKADLVRALLEARALGEGAAGAAAASPAEAAKIKAAAAAFKKHGDPAAAQAEVLLGRKCEGPGCSVASTAEAPLQSCSACQSAWYCSKECQRADWKREGGHKAACKAAAETQFLSNVVAAAAAGAAGGKKQAVEALAVYNQGLAYAAGRGVRQSNEKALECYRKAAEGGCKEAMTNLASCYGNGDLGLKQDWPAALAWFELASNAGDALASFNLAMRHYQGDGVPRSLANCVKWLKVGAAANHKESAKMLADLYWAGSGVTRDALEARRLWRVAALAGDTAAMERYANCCRDGPGPIDLAEALKFYRMGAADGAASCMTHVGMMHSKGMGVRADLAEARRWYDRAEKGGDANAISNIGNIYSEGRGVPRDVPRALAQYERAAALGHLQAALNAGLMLCAGEHGVPKDRVRGVALLRKAADAAEEEASTPAACLALAQELLTLGPPGGNGVPDFVEVEKYYRRAAALGSETARNTLPKLPLVRDALRKKGMPC